ncbi:MAG: class 1 fructose-bisphosphatase [Myxococcales bacterium]|nr:MAG: class 1 fructose-bisphosphatase [Myxococcales bacterium]
MNSSGKWHASAQHHLGWTLERHILEQQRRFPSATGDFTSLFQQIALAGKIIASRVNQAGLAGILGLTGSTNIQGEKVQKMDVFAHHTIIRNVEASGRTCVLASEEAEDPIAIPDEYPTGKYVLLFDPLDGSSNIDVNVSIGTIFSIHKRISQGKHGTLEDCLQVGSKQVAAGYVIYGSSTMFVYTTGEGVHGFTLDPTVGEFFLSHENIRIPKRGQVYSVNEGKSALWEASTQQWLASLKQPDKNKGRPYSARYIGTLVSDFHRTLLRGGIFAYPGELENPKGKLRLLYEAAPMAMLAEAAGGAASTGTQRILDVMPSALHARVPLFIGSKDDVAEAEAFFKS